jgi:hypothetical protein
MFPVSIASVTILNALHHSNNKLAFRPTRTLMRCYLPSALWFLGRFSIENLYLGSLEHHFVLNLFIMCILYETKEFRCVRRNRIALCLEVFTFHAVVAERIILMRTRE